MENEPILGPHKVVNMAPSMPDLVDHYDTAYRAPVSNADKGTESYDVIFNRLIANGGEAPPTNSFNQVKASDVDWSGRFPLYFPGQDNEEMYAQAQGSGEKAYNGIAKFAGIATSTFINGTVGFVAGLTESAKTGKFSSIYDNPVANELNDWTEGLENKYAHYKTLLGGSLQTYLQVTSYGITLLRILVLVQEHLLLGLLGQVLFLQ
jgi:hypothetical protein